jgi:hypothetical protein
MGLAPLIPSLWQSFPLNSLMETYVVKGDL